MAALSVLMQQPECLASLIDLGIIQEVVRPLMSGKEAQVYLVMSDDVLRVAKVYKTAHNRSFRQRVEYTEGRAVRNSRTRRAMNRHSRYGRAQEEASWRTTEVDIIYRLRAAGVRVPEPHHFSDGVLVMELISDADGDPAPRLTDVELHPDDGSIVFEMLLAEVVKMLCAGVVHGDLSEFNVLLGQDSPVLIDFPQAVDPAHNRNARRLLIRDVDNLNQVLNHGAPRRRRLPYGQELWDLYERGELTPETQLTGRYKPPRKKADTSAVLREIEAAARDARKRRDAQDPAPGRRGRKSRHGRRAKTSAEPPATQAKVAPAAAAVAPREEAAKKPTGKRRPRDVQDPAPGRRGRRSRPRRRAKTSAEPPATQAKGAPAAAVVAPGEETANKPTGKRRPRDAQDPTSGRRGRRSRPRRGSKTSAGTPATQAKGAPAAAAVAPREETATKPTGKRRRRGQRRRGPDPGKDQPPRS